MVTPELVSYIWSSRERGIADSIIKANLREGGWDERDFAEAIATLPPPHTKIEGPMLRQLSQNTVMTTPEQQEAEEKHRARMKKFWIVLLILGALIVWGFIGTYLYDPKIIAGMISRI